MKSKTGCLIIVILLIPAAVSGQLFEYPYCQTRSAGLGGVQTTGFSDAGSMLLNPAAIVKIERTTLSVMSGAAMPDITIEPLNQQHRSIRNEHGFGLYPSVALGFNLGTRLAAMGVAVTMYESSHLQYPDRSAQRYQATAFHQDTASLDVAFGFIPYQTVAVGIRVGYMVSDFAFERENNVFGADPGLSDEFDTSWKIGGIDPANINGAVGVIWTPYYRIELGLTYRPPTAYHYNCDFTVDIPELMGGNRLTSDVKDITVRIPQQISLGMHWIARDRLDLYSDFTFIHNRQVDSVRFTMLSSREGIIPEKFVIPVNMKNEFIFNLGLEYLATSSLSLRTGAYYRSGRGDTAYELAVFPAGERYGLTLGAGFKFARFVFDLAAGYNLSPDTRSTGLKSAFPLSADSSWSEPFISAGFHWLF